MDSRARESFMEDEKNRILSIIEERGPLMIKKLQELSQHKVSKDAETSIKLREEANKIFMKKSHSSEEHIQIWKMYTKCVAFAPPLSEELSAALYNRSSLFYHLQKYAECIQDLINAEKCDCSDLLKMKIAYRKAECSSKIKSPSNFGYVEAAITQIQNLSLNEGLKNETITKLVKMHASAAPSKRDNVKENSKSHQVYNIDFQEEIPCASTALSLEYTEEFGRHIVATRYIKPGEILIFERMFPLLNQSALYTHCSNCSKPTWASIPCGSCGFAVYCSEQCKDDAWSKYHDIECNIIGLLDLETDSGEIESQSVRLVLRALKENNGSIPDLRKKLIKTDKSSDNRTRGFSADGIFRSEACESYLSLLTNADKMPSLAQEIISTLAVKLVYYLASFTEIFGEKFSADDLLVISKQEDVLFIGSLISRMYHSINTNQFTLAEQRDVRSREEMPLNRGLETLGTAVAPFCSNINHACLPNVATCMTEDGCMIIFALLPINKGSQIFKKYKNSIACDECPRDLRRRAMRELYSIYDCKCMACVENLPIADEAPNINSITRDQQVLNLVNRVRYMQNARLTVGLKKTTETIIDCLETMMKKSVYRCEEFYILMELMIIFSYFMHDRWFQIPDRCRK